MSFLAWFSYSTVVADRPPLFAGFNSWDCSMVWPTDRIFLLWLYDLLILTQCQNHLLYVWCTMPMFLRLRRTIRVCHCTSRPQSLVLDTVLHSIMNNSMCHGHFCLRTDSAMNWWRRSVSEIFFISCNSKVYKVKVRYFMLLSCLYYLLQTLYQHLLLANWDWQMNTAWRSCNYTQVKVIP